MSPSLCTPTFSMWSRYDFDHMQVSPPTNTFVYICSINSSRSVTLNHDPTDNCSETMVGFLLLSQSFFYVYSPIHFRTPSAHIWKPSITELDRDTTMNKFQHSVHFTPQQSSEPAPSSVPVERQIKVSLEHHPEVDFYRTI